MSGTAIGFDTSPRPLPSEYREFAAPARLASHFRCFWTQTIAGARGDYTQRVLPDGCVDLVLIDDSPVAVVGPWTEPFIARLAPGTSILGARFHPGRAASLLGLPASEILNRSEELRAVSGKAAGDRLDRVYEQVTQDARRAALIEALLTGLEHANALDEAVAASIGWLTRHPEGRIEELSDWAGIGNRQLHRRFLAAVGYGPKMFQSVLRFQRLLKNLYQQDLRPDLHRSLADLAAEAGYADQAHMTREVSRFAGCSPTALLRRPENVL